MLELNLLETMRPHAEHFAKSLGLSLTEHGFDVYELLLTRVVRDMPENERTQEFSLLSRHFCTARCNVNRPEVRRRLATNALLIAHQREIKVGVLEDMADLHSGDLSKLKNGKGNLSLSPTQVFYISSFLQVPIRLLTEDFDNNPEGLQAELEKLGHGEVTHNGHAHNGTAHEPPDTGAISMEFPTPPAAAEGHSAATAATEARPAAAPEAAKAPPPREPSMAVVADNIRRFIQLQEGKNLTGVMSAVGINNRLFLNNVIKGKERLTDELLDKFAAELSLEVSVLKSGEGLPAPKTRTGGNALVRVSARTLLLPPVTEERRQEFFRSRCLRRDVEVAEGQHIGTLLEAAASTEPVDWYELWLSVTKEGESYRRSLEVVLKSTQPYGDVMKAQFFLDLHNRVFSAMTE